MGTERKPVPVRADVHHRLRVISFNNEIPLQFLVDAFLLAVLNDEAKVAEIVQSLRARK